MDTMLSYLISFSVYWQLISYLFQYILCLLSTSSSEELNVIQVLGLRIVLAHKGCVLAHFLRYSYLIQGFQLHMAEKFYCFLQEFGILKKQTNQLIGCSQILAEIIYQSNLSAEVETPVLNLSWACDS